jgi:hypothetical protein
MIDKHLVAAVEKGLVSAASPSGQTMIMQLSNGRWLVRFMTPDPVNPNMGTYKEGFGNSLIEALTAAGA